MLRIDPVILASIAPLWIAAGSAGLLVLTIGRLAFRRARTGACAAAGRWVLIICGSALCGSLTWALLAVAATNAERTTLEVRAQQLTTQALAPGSPLACLDALAGDTVAAACEKVVFASPANVAIAISFVAAQFALLSDMTDYTHRGGANIDSAMLSLRRALEADPFGLLAHVLVVRDGCSSENCLALRLLHDSAHVRTNLIAQTLDHYLDHYREVWGKSPEGPVAELPDAQPTGTVEGNAPGKRKVLVNIDFPTAASIPPVSIMNPEPTGPAVPRGAGSTTPEPARKHAAKPAAHDGALGGAVPPGTAAQSDPVWTPAPAQPTQ